MGTTCHLASTPAAQPAGSSAASACSRATRRTRPTGTPSSAHTPSRCVQLTSLTSWAVRTLGAPDSLSTVPTEGVVPGAAAATEPPAAEAEPCACGDDACLTALVEGEGGAGFVPALLGLSASSSMSRSIAAISNAQRLRPPCCRARPEPTKTSRFARVPASSWEPSKDWRQTPNFAAHAFRCHGMWHRVHAQNTAEEKSTTTQAQHAAHAACQDEGAPVVSPARRRATASPSDTISGNVLAASPARTHAWDVTTE